jgi:hypothetical protein
MARTSSPIIPTESGRPEYTINAEADKALSRIVTNHFVAFGVLLVLMTIAMSFLNIEGTPIFRIHRYLDTISILIVMVPFFLGTSKFFAARLQFGRDFIQKKQWKEAVASLEAFSHMGQRFLDRTGEAHYLLSVALDHQGKIAAAQKARDFVLKSRPTSAWAGELRKMEEIRPRASRLTNKRAENGVKPEEIRPRPAKSRRRRA